MPKSGKRAGLRETPLDASDLDGDPLKQFAAWFQPRAGSGVPEAHAMTLATATKDGSPFARTVLLKEATERGFVFFTNYGSPKARQLMENPRATLVFYWPEVHRQVVVSGRVTQVTDAESDAYFRTRPRGSQLSAWASRQSERLESREALERRVTELDGQYAGREVPRPPFWGGFRLVPERFEFWQGRSSRLHDRFCYSRDGGRWVIERLAP
uniref:Pyridoxamine 5'-phosphate oxidase n=1 Tax=uncultured Gemmatimonadetes bacterium Rifle_16ft_4_minimus_7 TaxID=1665098 RepID=A0A0H4TDL2_9BACT|nr:pyridoxamine 5'-phosphate oxidase, pyridoxamine 5'-phosphate oxidase [uncultured Gemmatimonadetes bacterium Rifle_16ft_4_minimus_7]